MEASRRRPVWVVIPAKQLRYLANVKFSLLTNGDVQTLLFHIRQIGVVSNLRSPQSPLATLHNHEFGSETPSLKEMVQKNSGQVIRRNNGISREDLVTDTEVEPAPLVDRSSLAHCEVERRRKQRITTSIQKLAEMLQLKEIDSTKLAKADILKLAVDKIHTLNRSNAEFESRIAGSIPSAPSDHQCLNEKLEGLLLEHLSLKKQLLQVSQEKRSHKKTSSNVSEEEEPLLGTEPVINQTESLRISNLSENPVLSESNEEDRSIADKMIPKDSELSLMCNSGRSLDCTRTQNRCDAASDRESGERVYGQDETKLQGSGCSVEKVTVHSNTGSKSHSRSSHDAGQAAVCVDAPAASTFSSKEHAREEELAESQDLSTLEYNCEIASVEVEPSCNSSCVGMLEHLVQDGGVSAELPTTAESLKQPPRGVVVAEQLLSDAEVSAKSTSDSSGVERPSPVARVSQQNLPNTGAVEQSSVAAMLEHHVSRAGSLPPRAEMLGQSTGVPTSKFPPSSTGLELLLRDSEVQSAGSSSACNILEGSSERSKQASSSEVVQHHNEPSVQDQNRDAAIVTTSQLPSSVETKDLSTNSEISTVDGCKLPAASSSNLIVQVSPEQPPSTCLPSYHSHQTPFLQPDLVQPSLSLSDGLNGPLGTLPSSVPSHVSPSSEVTSPCQTGYSPSAGTVNQTEQPWPVSSLLSESNISIPMSSSDRECVTTGSGSSDSTALTDIPTMVTNLASTASLSSVPSCLVSYSSSASVILNSGFTGSNCRSSSSDVRSSSFSNSCHSVACQVTEHRVAGTISEKSKRNSREDESMADSRQHKESPPKKRARTGDPFVSLHQGAVQDMDVSQPHHPISSLHNFHMPLQSGLTNQMAERVPSLDASMHQQVAVTSLPSSHSADSRHCGTFAANCSGAHSSLPQSNRQQTSQCYSHHCHPSSSVIVQPWLDQANGQAGGVAHHGQPQLRGRKSRTANRSTGRERASDDGGRSINGGYYKPWSDGQQQQQPFHFASQPMTHPFPNPPPQPHPPQHLDAHHPHTLFYQPHEYDSWSLHYNKMKQNHHSYGSAVLQPTTGSGWRTTSSSQSYLQRLNMGPSDGSSGERQWNSCNHQRHSSSFVPHDHMMSCEGVWRPYSETSPSRGFCASESAGPSLPSHNLAYMDHATLPSSQRLSMGHISVAHSNYSEATPSHSSHPVQVGPPSHVIPLTQNASHQESHFLQMEPTQPTSHHPNAHSSALSNQQHTLQMEHNQPTSRTESFFVDRLLYDIG